MSATYQPYPRADRVLKVGDRVRVTSRRFGVTWEARITAVNLSAGPFQPYYQVTDGIGWYWHPDVVPLESERR